MIYSYSLTRQLAYFALSWGKCASMTIYSFRVLYFGWAFIAGDGRDAVSSLVEILYYLFIGRGRIKRKVGNLLLKSSWESSACYPRRTFDPLSEIPSTRDSRITDELPAYTIHHENTMLKISEWDMLIQHRSSIGIDWILVLAKIIDMSRTHRKVLLFNTTYEDPSPINIS